MKSEAGKWLAEQGEQWGSVKRRSTNPVVARRHAIKANHPTPKDFVEGVRHKKTPECVFVTSATKGFPAQVTFCGRQISAARYMALLTYGAPRNEGAVVRHLCGNGHLSCVNPAHLEWGSETNNRQDAGKHRGLETAQDKIHATSGRR